MRPPRRRVAIVAPASHFDSTPSLTSAALLLAQHGYLVDVFTSSDSAHVPAAFEDHRIEVLPMALPSRRQRPWPWRAIPRAACWPLWLRSRHRACPYVCLIGVDPEGLAAAAGIARWVNAPTAYFSLELLLSWELTNDNERALKEQERSLCANAVFAIVQDPERAALLVQDSGIPASRVLCVPNAPLGRADIARSDYLRSRFGIPAERKIILHSGTLSRWSGADAMMVATHAWPDNWVLVCHTRYRATTAALDYLSALTALAKPGSVLFSTDPLPWAAYPLVVRSADVSLAYYCPIAGSRFTLDNIRHIGLSSGKLAYSLQAGVPAVMTAQPSLQRLADAYGCGVVVDAPASNRAAIEGILDNYAAYSAAAAKCFDDEFEYSNRFATVLQAIAALS